MEVHGYTDGHVYNVVYVYGIGINVYRRYRGTTVKVYSCTGVQVYRSTDIQVYKCKVVKVYLFR